MILFETERLLVQRFTPAEEDLFFQVNGSPEVMRFIRPAKTKEECAEFFRENLNFYKNGSLLGRFAVFTKEGGLFAGTFSYLYLTGETGFHLGYALVPSAWNKGYATELVLAAVPYFFRSTQHPAVFAITSPENIASQRVLRKAGFGYQGQLQEGGKPIEVFYINRNLSTENNIEGL